MKKLGIIGWLLLALALFAPETAKAVDCGLGAGTCFALTGNTNVGTSWSDTDGGVNCNATCPTGPAATDAAVLTSNSGALTLNAALTVTSFNACAITGTAAYTNTLTHNSAITLTVSGNDAGAPAGGVSFCFSTGMTYTRGATTSALTFTATSGTTTITANSSGTSRNIGNATFNGVGGTFLFGSDLTSAGAMSLTNGTVNANNFNVGFFTFDANNTNTKVITLGNGTWTGTVTAGSFWVVGATGTTLNAGSSTLVYAPAATTQGGFNGGTGLTYNNLTINFPGGTSPPIEFLYNSGNLGGNLTFNSDVRIVRFIVSPTIGGTISYSGTSVAPSILSGGGSVRNVTLAGSPTLSWLTVQGINENGAGTITCTNCVDAGGNSNIVFVPTSTNTSVAPGIR